MSKDGGSADGLITGAAWASAYRTHARARDVDCVSTTLP